MKANDVHEKIIQELKKTLRGDLKAVYVFGSSITEFATTQSDIDIAVICRFKVERLNLWDIGQEIAVVLNRDVDLLDLRGVTTVVQMQVVSTGRRIFCIDEEECEKFEGLVFSSYALLNEERREILEDIKARGSIYGR